MIKDYIEALKRENLETVPLNGALDLLSMGYKGHCLWKARQQFELETKGESAPKASFILIEPKKK